MIVYEGPSLWDGITPIVAIVTGLHRASENRKTGFMLQTWILVKHMHPSEALKFGEDEVICGNCIHRPMNGHRSCYVGMMQGPARVWNKYNAGGYPYVDPEEAGEICSGRKIRIGSYGDPAMVPANVWKKLIRYSALTTGYTHQWRDMPTVYREFCMASCDTVQDVADAAALGYRAFRVKTPEEDPLKDEVVCPASDEAGNLTQCERCGLCSGAKDSGSGVVPNIVITVHGRGAKYYRRERQSKEAHTADKMDQPYRHSCRTP